MASQTLDDTVAALLSMGFQLQDAQDAIQYGKVNTQDAVEWILAGKPGYVAGGPGAPTLKLNNTSQNSSLPSLRPDTRVPFVNPLPVADSVAADSRPPPPSHSSITDRSADPSSSDIDMEQQVISRLHLTDAKLAEKKHFEEKKRAEAERKAKQEKMQAKRERDRVLKEIAEDRKMSKMMRTYGPTSPGNPASDTAHSSKSETSSSQPSPSHSTPSVSTQCSIQIRLPNGQQLRKKLDPNMTLGQLWSIVIQEAEAQTLGHSGFMQPFPRREFSAAEMNKTLQQLGLVPSGSLVLKKGEPTVAVPEPESEPVEPAEPSEGDEADQLGTEGESRRGHPYGEWQPVARQGHSWGRGRALDTQDDAGGGAGAQGGDEAMEEDEEEENVEDNHRWGRGRALEDGDNDVQLGDDDNRDDDDDDGDMDPLIGGGVNPILQGFLGHNQGVFGDRVLARGAFMGVGLRLIPLGAPGADQHVNRPVGDLAAEAAQQRLARPPPELPAPACPKAPAPCMQVAALQDSCIKLVIERILSPSAPVHSLGRLPESLSEKIIQHLLQQKLLDAKILRIFLSSCLRRLVLDTYTYATNELLFGVRLHTRLQVLSLHSCPLISDQGIQHLVTLKHVKVLNLGLCKQLTDKCLKIIAGFTQLHTLSLEETGVTDAGLFRYLDTRPPLRNLNLSRTAVTNTIFLHLKNLQQLQVLYLEETKISSLEGVEELTQLVSLNLASTLITAPSLACLSHLPHFSQLSLTNTEQLHGDTALLCIAGLKLKSLCLPDRHSVTSEGLIDITGFPLHTLDLTNYIHVGDEGMQYVGQITSLVTLMLSNTKVTDEGLLQLSNLTKLTVLHLDRTCVSDVGVSVVKAFRDLSELSLSGTNVTNHFLREGVLHACQNLSKLNLSRTHVGDKGVEKLKLPHLTMLNLDCTGVHARVVDVIRSNCPSLRSVTTANLTPVLEEEEEEA